MTAGHMSQSQNHNRMLQLIIMVLAVWVSSTWRPYKTYSRNDP